MCQQQLKDIEIVQQSKTKGRRWYDGCDHRPKQLTSAYVAGHSAFSIP